MLESLCYDDTGNQLHEYEADHPVPNHSLIAHAMVFAMSTDKLKTALLIQIMSSTPH